MKQYKIPTENKQRSMTTNATDMRRGLKRMGTWVGVGGTSEEHGASDHATTTTTTTPLGESGETYPDNKGTPEAAHDHQAADTDSDDGLRLTVSHADRYGLTGRLRDDGTINAPGRRMSSKDLIKQMQQLDPKAKLAAVKEGSAADDRTPETKRQGREEKSDGDGAGTTPSWRPPHRAAETTTPTLRPRPAAGRRAETEIPPRRGYDSSRPGPVRTRTEETLVRDETDDEDVPTYDMTATLARHGKGRTAADSRRQRLTKISSDDGAGDEGEQVETAAEKRRRLAALGEGEGGEDSSSDEDADAPRRPKEEKEPVAELSRQRPRVQWGGERGREKGREKEGEAHQRSRGLKGVFRKRPGS
jgi:hypothetical protein